MRLTPEEPRQAPEVWQAWNKLHLPQLIYSSYRQRYGGNSLWEPAWPIGNRGVMVTTVHAQTAWQQGTPHLGPVPGAVGESATGVGRTPPPTLPKEEISLLIHALTSMNEHTVLQRPRVAVACPGLCPGLCPGSCPGLSPGLCPGLLSGMASGFANCTSPNTNSAKNSKMQREWLPSTRPSFMNIACKGGTSSTLTGQQRNTRRWGGWEDMECFSAVIGIQ